MHPDRQTSKKNLRSFRVCSFSIDMNTVLEYIYTDKSERESEDFSFTFAVAKYTGSHFQRALGHNEQII